MRYSILASVVVGLASAAYDEAVAMRAMYYSGASYCAKQTLNPWACGEPCTTLGAFTDMTLIENELLDTFGIAGYNAKDDEVVLAFRGTNGADFLNWLTNIVYYRVQYADIPNTQVHSGFYTAYTAVSWTTLGALQTLLAKYPTAALMITGHSLGGALATFAALDIKRSLNLGTRAVHFYTFGSPRTGNQAFTDYVMTLYPNGGYNRVTHYTDLIVQIPPRQMGFNHAGNEAWYYNSDTMELQICPNTAGTPESPNCADSYIFTTGVDAHLHYMGKAVSGMCLQRGERDPAIQAAMDFNRTHPALETPSNI